MSQQPVWSGASRNVGPSREVARPQPANLADILERVLDKGIVIAGDIRINLLDIELLTIKIRLIVASVDRAREMGIDWWEHDPSLSSGKRDVLEENRRLRQRIGELQAGRDAHTDDAVEPGDPDDRQGSAGPPQRQSRSQNEGTSEQRGDASP
ncbi:gas vesicle protein [Streptomyces silvisoli]|uniref:Gas vesicle protein n=1 Tax=Streptomyces silvisoli TaxID=3034235 RepID=A0ABT5ZT61_9ACTN|nr:gas vesicle protein [Streptomyces silvisoli]MDF3293022.1 gas vesicle protein [Streptomyces silvisoli]